MASPRLQRLQAAAAADPGALASFWDAVRRDGAPLIEPGRTEHERLVTFLWRSAAETRVVVLADFGDYVPHMTLVRLPGTDVWQRSLRLDDDVRLLYELAVDDPAYPFVDGDEVRYPAAPQPDPLNPRRWEYAKPHILSLLELPRAPALEPAEPDAAIPHGSVERLEPLLRSERLGNERKIFAYRPAGYDEAGAPYPLLLFGASYIHQIRLPRILDRLIAEHRIPPVVAVFIDYPPGRQDEELGGGAAYGDFVAGELLPWVRERLHVTRDPRRVVIGGASAGGHSAACVALQHPEAIGNVLAQSGAFWRGLEHTAGYWSDPALDEGREGFARLAASRPAAPVRFYLTIGRLERGVALSADGVTMLRASRHVRDVLQAKGYAVTLRETSGGHDPYNWEAALPEALVALIGAPAAGVR
ncbi:MAG TPA: alpha/beta hydrolase-fold protein [Candidatus Polarisedimenticolaceae bacterium]|nr:alpha/beta hydrolase-fold protein [Candidatus Polarisedimenticolaceae bacterium]